MVRTSLIDAKIWICKLRQKKIVQFEYKDLPKELRYIKFLRRAKIEGLITRVNKNENGRNIWRITDKTKCKGGENGDVILKFKNDINNIQTKR